MRIAVDPGTHHARIVLDYSVGSVVVVDTMTNRVVGVPIDVGSDPTDVAVAPEVRRAYVSDSANGDVSVGHRHDRQP